MSRSEKHSQPSQDILRGLPEPLRPQADAPTDPYRVVDDGPRNLACRPFDYRNPLPTTLLAELDRDWHGGSTTEPIDWPVDDAGAPFDYYINGRAGLGVPGGPECGIVDLFGTLRMFTGAWAFGLGEGAAPPRLRAKRLVASHRPDCWAETTHAGRTYRFTWSAVRLDEAPPVDYPAAGNPSYEWAGSAQPRGRNLFYVMRCRVDGPADGVILHTGFSQAPARCAGCPGSGGLYAPPWTNLRWDALGGGFLRLLADHEGTAYTLGVLMLRNCSASEAPRAIDHWPPATPRSPQRDGWAELALSAEPGGGEALVEWRIAGLPMPAAEDACLLGASSETLDDRAASAWDQRRRVGLQLALPEAKVESAFHQAMNHLDMCLVTLDESVFPTPGPSGGYHRFFDRDAVDMIHAYDIVGDVASARAMMRHYWLREVDQESSGMILWLLGKHYRLTRDRDWLAEMMPEVIRRMSWLVRCWAGSREENDGLLPITSAGDNERIKGHYVSYHMYAVAGARYAALLAEAAGREALACQWGAFHRQFRSAVLRAMGRTVAGTGGVITPGFAGYDEESCEGSYGPSGGIDWHNMGAVFPTELLPPDHPWIDSSLRRWRHVYLEGIVPYPFRGKYYWAHNYNTMNLSEAWLRRGDWAETLRDLYGVLLHTGSTHASGEVIDTAGRQDLDCTPHNWFSGKLVRFVRDLLVYEGGDDRLHLLGCLSPAWLGAGERLSISDAPTELGPISLHADVREDGLDLRIDHQGRPDCRGLALHLPPFLQDVSVRADGVPVARAAKDWPLPAGTTRVSVDWRPGPMPDLSFARVVESFVKDYRCRVQQRKAQP